MSKHLRTAKQEEILTNLSTNFGIDEDRILFLNPRDANEPWIPSDELESIARQIGGIKSTSVLHDRFLQETNQVCYVATVIDVNGVSYSRSGVAMIGEKPNEIDIDAETLAAGRALGAALRAAGFHPYRSGSVVNFTEMREEIEANRIRESIPAVVDEITQRTKDIRQIKALATEKGLIKKVDGSPADLTEYRKKLQENFGVNTVVMMNESQRAAVINWLKNIDDDFLQSIPEEFREEAKAA